MNTAASTVDHIRVMDDFLAFIDAFGQARVITNFGLVACMQLNTQQVVHNDEINLYLCKAHHVDGNYGKPALCK